MRIAANPLTERLAEIGGQLQKLRWEALDSGYQEMAQDIAHAIEAVAWAAGIYAAGANIVARPEASGQTAPATEVPAAAEQIRITNAA